MNAIFPQEDFKNMAAARIGGKTACLKQRELRARLFAKAPLKSLPAGADMVGTGVCKFTFRLLSDVRDPDYIKVDSGERHVFEVTRTDGSAAHLHFNKNGKCDKP